jgi:hypothetical protein
LEHLDEYGVDFVLFDSKRSEKEWVSEKPGKYTYVAKILKTLIPKVSDRKKFVDEWVYKGKLIHMKDGVMNPFLEKFFYIEGLFSNNLRLSLSGSEINHPDKAYGALFNRIKEVIDDPIKLEILLTAEGITDFNVEEFKTFKTVSDLNGTKYQQIYDKTIIEIINTE